MRDRTLAHRANAFCASCHNVMDPVGFSLENFDAVGAWRTRDSGFPVDPVREALRRDAGRWPGEPASSSCCGTTNLFLTNFAKNMLMYANGRVFQPYDMPAVRTIVGMRRSRTTGSRPT